MKEFEVASKVVPEEAVEPPQTETANEAAAQDTEGNAAAAADVPPDPPPEPFTPNLDLYQDVAGASALDETPNQAGAADVAMHVMSLPVWMNYNTGQWEVQNEEWHRDGEQVQFQGRQWGVAPDALAYQREEYANEEYREYTTGGQMEELGLAEEGQGQDFAEGEWERYVASHVDQGDTPLSYEGFWAENLAAAHNATPEDFAALTPLQQRLYIRTTERGLEVTGEPDWAIYDTMELVGDVVDPERRGELMVETIAAAGSGTDGEGAGSLDLLGEWATERNPELAARIEEEGAAAVVADTVGPDGVSALVTSGEMSTGDRLDLLAEGIARGWIDPAQEAALFAQAVSDAGDMSGLEAWLQADPERAEQLEESGGAAEWLVANRGVEEAVATIANAELDPDVRSSLFGAIAPELAREPESPEEAALMFAAINGYVDAANQDGDVTTALGDTLSWAAQDPTSSFSQALLAQTIATVDDPERLATISGDMATLVSATRHPDDPEAAQAEAARLSPILADPRMAALMTGPAGATGRVLLLEAVLSDPNFTIESFEESFERHFDWGSFDHRWDENAARDGLLESSFAPFAQQWADYRGGEGETLGGEDIDHYVAFTMGGGMLANDYDGELEVSEEAQAAAEATSATIAEFAEGGPVDIQAVPVQYASDDTGAVVLPVFQVRNAEGETVYVDNQGRRYESLDAYAEQARLADGFVTVPQIGADGQVVRDEHGQVQLDTHQHYDDHTIVDDAMLVGGIAGAVAMTVASGGLLAPGAAAIVGGVGLTAATASAGWGLYSGVESLHDRDTHGETINPLESRDAALAWLDVVGNSLGLAGTGLSLLGKAGGMASWATRADDLAQVTGRIGDVADAAQTGLSAVDIVDALASGQMGFGEAMTSLGQLAFMSYGLPRATQLLVDTTADFTARQSLSSMDFADLEVLRTTPPDQLTDAQRRLLDVAQRNELTTPEALARFGDPQASSPSMQQADQMQLTRDLEQYSIDPDTGTVILGEGLEVGFADPMATMMSLAATEGVTPYQTAAYLQLAIQQNPDAFVGNVADMLHANPEFLEGLSPEAQANIGQAVIDLGVGWEQRAKAGEPVDPEFLAALSVMGGEWIGATTEAGTDPLGRSGNEALSTNGEAWGEAEWMNTPDRWTDMNLPYMYWNYLGDDAGRQGNFDRYDERAGIVYANETGVRIASEGRDTVTRGEIEVMRDVTFVGEGVTIDANGQAVVAIRTERGEAIQGYLQLDPVTRQPVVDKNGELVIVSPEDVGETRAYFSRANVEASFNGNDLKPNGGDAAVEGLDETAEGGATEVEATTAPQTAPQGVGYDDLQAVLDQTGLDVPHLLTSGQLDPAEIPGVLALVGQELGPEARQGALMNALILEDGGDPSRQSAWNDFWTSGANGEAPEAGNAATGLVSTWDEQGLDPSAEVQSALAGMPQDPAYRDEFLGSLVEQGYGPNQVVAMLAGEDGQLSDLEVQLLADATAGTRFEDDVAYAIGANGLREGTVTAESLATIEQAAIAGTASTEDLAMLAFASSRGLTTDRALELYRATDPETGALDLQDPSVRELLVDPALGAFTAEEGVDRGAVVLGLLNDARAAGGEAAVQALLGEMSTGLAVAGSSLAQQIAGMPPEQRAQFAAMLGDSPEAKTVLREAEWQALATSGTPDVNAYLASVGIDPSVPDASRAVELAPWFLQSLPEDQRGPWLEAFAAAGVDTTAIAGNAMVVGQGEEGAALQTSWDGYHLAMMDTTASSVATTVPLTGPDASGQAMAFLLAVPADQRGSFELGPYVAALGPDAASDPYVAHVLALYGVSPEPADS